MCPGAIIGPLLDWNASPEGSLISHRDFQICLSPLALPLRPVEPAASGSSHPGTPQSLKSEGPKLPNPLLHQVVATSASHHPSAPPTCPSVYSKPGRRPGLSPSPTPHIWSVTLPARLVNVPSVCAHLHVSMFIP